METITTSTDEGEPLVNLSFYSFFFISIFFFVSCSDGGDEKKKHLAVIKDSSHAVKKTIPPITISTAKKKKRIYLTFDDGPNKGTRNVLDIMEQENIPVTFFIVGEHVFASSSQSQTWDSLKAAKNIELCNHSYTHAMHNHYEKFYQQPDSVVKDVEHTQETLSLDNNIVRAPGRNSWRIDSLHFTDIKKSKAAIDSLQKAGFIVLGWDLQWDYDAKTLQVKSNADEMLKQIDSLFRKGRTRTKDNLVLLAHDQVYRSSSDSLQLRDFVQKLKKKDEYELMLVSSYPGINKMAADSNRVNLMLQ